MAVLIQILLMTFVTSLVTSTPIFGEFTWKKNIDVGFKPIPFKPIAFIKEAWSPFGIFGVKKGIVKREIRSEPKGPIPELGKLFKALAFKPLTFIKEKWTPFGVFGEKHGFVKRDLDQIVPPPEKPKEQIPVQPMPVQPAQPILVQARPIQAVSIRPMFVQPVTEQPKPVQPMLVQPMSVQPVSVPPVPVISPLSRLPAAVYEEPREEPIEVTPVPKLGPVVMGPVPLATEPVPAPPPPTVLITPPPVEKEPFEGLNTNIGRDEDFGNYLSSTNEITPIVPEKAPPKAGLIQDNLIVRGSKLAFDLGSLLLEIFSQFLGRGKFT